MSVAERQKKATDALLAEIDTEARVYSIQMFWQNAADKPQLFEALRTAIDAAEAEHKRALEAAAEKESKDAEADQQEEKQKGKRKRDEDDDEEADESEAPKKKAKRAKKPKTTIRKGQRATLTSVSSGVFSTDGPDAHKIYLAPEVATVAEVRLNGREVDLLFANGRRTTYTARKGGVWDYKGEKYKRFHGYYVTFTESVS